MVLTRWNRQSITSPLLAIRVMLNRFLLHRLRNARCYCIVDETLLVVVIPRKQRVQRVQLSLLRSNKDAPKNTQQYRSSECFSCVVAPSFYPRNFRLIQALDSTTVQFAWDLPLITDELGIRGLLKAYQVIGSHPLHECMYARMSFA